MINENGLLNIFPTAEASGSIVSFENGADGIPMESLSVAVEPIQDLHGYSNPWIGTDYDQQPYNFRAVSSSSVSPLGNSEMGNIVGGTVAWNQLATTGQRTIPVTPDGTHTFSTSSIQVSTNANHVYFIAMTVKNYNGGKTLRAYCQINAAYGMPAQDLTGTSKAFAWLCKSSTGGASISYGLSNLATADNLTSADAWTRDDTQVIDLTAMFGSAIADYLYTLESGTAGAGIAKLKSWGFCTKDYYAYDSGSLQSVQTSAHKTYKADSTLLGNYALDSSLTLRGIPKLDANNNLYYDGDGYAPDGTVTRKYGIVDLGTFTAWSEYAGYPGLFYINAALSGAKIPASNAIKPNIVCDSYIAAISRDIGTTGHTNGEIAIATNRIYISNDTYTGNLAGFKSAIQGVYLVYELATPTTETATAYAATQSIDPDGTEEYVDYAESQGTRDVAIPVGHYTNYANICPITGRTGLSVYVSPTQDVADATTYAVDWTSEAGTVYGGTLDVVTGLLTVDRAAVTLDGTEAWANDSNSQSSDNIFCFRAYLQNDNIKKPDGTASTRSYIGKMFADTMPTLKNGYTNQYPMANTVMGVTGYSGGSGNYLYIVTNKSVSNVQSVSELKSWLAENPTTVVYELATPLTYQLTPQEVATLLGANRVWSDAGDISLVYHTQVDATPSSIDGLFINGEGLQADGWFLKWRKLAAPKPKTDYVSVWGRDGDIDLTESETGGQVFYENRELTMDMVYVGEDWTDAYSELLDMLHGKECAVQFSNDPYWYWAGRIIASLYEHKPHSLTMSGIMFPYKLSVAKITKSATVSGAIESNGVEVVLPSSRMRVSPKVTVVAGTGESVTLKWGTKTQTLSAGTYYVRGLKVGSDDVTIKVWGTGTVTFEYRKGML